MQKSKLERYLEKIAQGVLISLCVLTGLFSVNKDVVLGQLCLHEILPRYEIDSSMKTLFKFRPGGPDAATVFAQQEEELNGPDDTEGLIGLDDIVFQPETDYVTNEHFNAEAFVMDDLSALHDMSYLKKNFYAVDGRTDMSSDMFNVDNFLSCDLTIDNALDGPKVLVFHTHSNETYADSAGRGDGVVGVGEALCDTLMNKYGIQALHNTDSFDTISGKSHIMGAYERMEPVITGILRDNPSIQVVIDLHRDGVADSMRLVHDINGKSTAQIMFFNGLSRMYDEGELVDIDSLPNPNLGTNLALSFQMQLAANNLYPGLTRKVYLNAYRYSLHMMPKSMLIEVGAQTNTKEEALNAVEPLADMLARVLL